MKELDEKLFKLTQKKKTPAGLISHGGTDIIPPGFYRVKLRL